MSYQLRPSQHSPSQQESGYDTYSSTSPNTYYPDQQYGYGYNQGQYVYIPGQGQPQPLQQQQYQPDMTHTHSQPPSPLASPLALLPAATTTTTNMYPQDGVARTHTWVANQPAILSPPAAAKTPFSEWAVPTDSTFDRHTLYSPSMPPRPPPDKPRVCGIKRNTFYVVLAISSFLLVVAVAIGLGVGLGTRKGVGVVGSEAAVDLGADSSSSSLVSPTSTTPTSTTSTTPTSTKVSPTPSFTGALTPGPVDCPQNNNTVYVARGSSKPFNVQCGRDYNSQHGAKDIKHMHTPTMASCIDACGDDDDCVGVGWGYYQDSFQCWMKSALGEPNWSAQWYFAQLQHMPGSKRKARATMY
ncbi:hypothetical protein F5B19DRAFT_208699 [Rostrohypoxylon terebratum]|nr:hypothetical protein F5B19DRAFT_208699 [Rostrohypoxylon terebratum]